MKFLRNVFRFLISKTIGRRTGMYWLATHAETKLLNFLDSGYLYENGWFRSLNDNKSIDLKGEWLAWLPYTLLKFLNERLTTEMRVLEFGSGASSFYFAKRVRSVVSIEDNKDWYASLISQKPKNLTLVLAKTKDSYVNIQQDNHQFDIILVDGLYREECCLKCVDFLDQRGVVILDDTNTQIFNELIPKMTQLGFKHLRFNDYAPIVTYNKETTIFYREKNCFNI